jgi:hypothetical protein
LDSKFFKQQALRARDLAKKADPFTRKRLLDRADRYDAEAGGPSRTSRRIGRPVSFPGGWPVSTGAQSGEA